MDSSIKLTTDSISTINILSSSLYTDDLRQESIPLFPEATYITFLLFPSKNNIFHHNITVASSFTKASLFYQLQAHLCDLFRHFAHQPLFAGDFFWLGAPAHWHQSQVV